MFITVPWEKSNSFQGNGEMFLFTLVPTLKKYSWTKANDFFMNITEKSISFGGGSAAGLWLDDGNQK